MDMDISTVMGTIGTDSERPAEGSNDPRESPDPQTVAEDALRRVLAAMLSAGKKKASASVNDRGYHCTLNIVPKKSQASPLASNLPKLLAGRRGAIVRVYIALRDARSVEGGTSKIIWQKELHRMVKAVPPGDEVSDTSMYRVVKELHKKLKLIRRTKLGWMLGEQPADASLFD